MMTTSSVNSRNPAGRRTNLMLLFSVAALAWSSPPSSAFLAVLSMPTPNRTTHDINSSISDGALARARNLTVPAVSTVTGGETEHADWWRANADLLREAWEEWEAGGHQKEPTAAGDNDYVLPPLLPMSRLVVEPLRRAVEQVWQDPTVAFEQSYRQEHWTEEAPGIYTAQLFSPEAIRALRAHLDAASTSRIPTRRPNGMNRYGLILHPSDQVDGAVHLTEFEQFYQELVDTYLRPTARALFPQYAGSDEDDAESYAFTIKYSGDLDVELKEHADASLYTLNVNLNLLPQETYEGSDLQFVVDDNGTKQQQHHYHNLTLQPGQAVLHLGQTRHRAVPIQSGTRCNLVVWMHGRHGYVRIAPYDAAHGEKLMSVRQRWINRSRSSSSQQAEAPIQSKPLLQRLKEHVGAGNEGKSYGDEEL